MSSLISSLPLTFLLCECEESCLSIEPSLSGNFEEVDCHLISQLDLTRYKDIATNKHTKHNITKNKVSIELETNLISLPFVVGPIALEIAVSTALTFSQEWSCRDW